MYGKGTDLLRLRARLERRRRRAGHAEARHRRLRQTFYQGQVEGSIAYKYKLTDTLSVTGTGGLGFAWGNTGYAGGAYAHGAGANAEAGNADDSFGYYFVQASLDYKLDSHWTWNVVQGRYRNAFTETWITPKVTTGITYNIDATDAVYANIGYGWKGTRATATASSARQVQRGGRLQVLVLIVRTNVTAAAAPAGAAASFHTLAYWARTSRDWAARPPRRGEHSGTAAG